MTEINDRVEDLVAQGRGPQAAQALKQRGEQALSAGEIRQAGQAFKRALQIQPEDPEALLGLARVCVAVDIPEDAEYLLGQCLALASDDADVLNGIASVYIDLRQLDQAKAVLQRSLQVRPAQEQVVQTLYALDGSGAWRQGAVPVACGKIAVFCGADGMTFMNDVAAHLRRTHDVRIFSDSVVTQENQAQFHQLLQWCDVAWMEWATNLAGAITQLRPKPDCHKIVRLHRYEAYLPQISSINWDMVDTLVTVGNSSVLEQLRSAVASIDKRTNVVTIPNGVDLQRYPFTPREKGKNLAFIANMRMVKNMPFLLQCLHRLCREDPEYRLFIAGRRDDVQLQQYLAHAVEKLGLTDNIVVDGYVKHMPVWLRDKHFVVCTSLIESQGMGIMEAMACGLKPVVHNFPGAGEIYEPEMLFLTSEEFCTRIQEDPYQPEEYRRFIERRYSLDVTNRQVDELISSCLAQSQSKPARKDQTPASLGKSSASARTSASPRPESGRSAGPRLAAGDEADICHSPVFVIGSGRSGNTLVRRILQRHEAIHIPPETYVLGNVIELFEKFRDLPWPLLVHQVYGQFEFHPEFETFQIRLGPLARKLAALEDSKRCLARLLHEFYVYHAASCGKKKIRLWGDKTPLNVFCLDQIDKVFPKAKYIHILRNGYDAAYSYVKAGIYDSLPQAAKRWKDSVQRCLGFVAPRNDRACQVRYEDLVSDPASQTRKMCDFLGVSYSDALWQDTDHCDKMGDTVARSHHRNVRKPVFTQSVGKARKELSAGQFKQLEAAIGSFVKKVGYKN
jgi:hypothetical protein